MYPTIPHTSSPPGQLAFSAALSVDHAPELTLRQPGRRKPALPELGRDHGPDLIVLVLAVAQFGVAPTHELLDRFLGVHCDVRPPPDPRGLRAARFGRPVA